MKHTHNYELSVNAVAKHFDLTPRTVRARLKKGDIVGVRIGGEWRFSWQDVWAAEKGPSPRGKRTEAFKVPLLSMTKYGATWSVSQRTVERWIADGMPTRNVFGSVRIAHASADIWVRRHFNIKTRTKK